jgi:hypothetical protein
MEGAASEGIRAAREILRSLRRGSALAALDTTTFRTPDRNIV